MPSLERFFPPIARFFDTNIKSLPNARLYFFRANSTTLKATFKDKVGDIAHANPVEADASGYFPAIFLSGLYRVELRDSSNITQPGWPVDNVGQDSAIVPFAPWSEIVTYQTDDVVTSPDGFWFRSRIDNNLGLDPDDNSGIGGDWELIVIPIADNFTSDVNWLTFSDSGTQLSLDVNATNLLGYLGLKNNLISGDDLFALPISAQIPSFEVFSWQGGLAEPDNTPESGAGHAERLWLNNDQETLVVTMATTKNRYIAQKNTTWGPWDPIVISEDITLTGDFSGSPTVTCSRSGPSVTITFDSFPTHTSGTTAASQIGVVPAEYRPNFLTSNVNRIVSGSHMEQITVSQAGTITLGYTDFTGAGSAQTSPTGLPTISYNVD